MLTKKGGNGIAPLPEDPITLTLPISPQSAVPLQPRAQGAVTLSVKRALGGTALEGLRMAGSLKCLFPRCDKSRVEAVLINTGGGITGGDRFNISAVAAPGTALTLTTQAAERAYRAQPGEVGHLSTTLRVGRDARLHWLPQETILFNGSALTRKLTVELETGASLLLVEPLIFGRAATGEVLADARFRDCIDIRRTGQPLFLDRTALDGNIAAHLARPHVADGALAMALIVYVAADAGARLARLRGTLPETAGASLIGDDMLVARCLAEDGFALRQTILPALKSLSDAELPKCWML